MENTEKKALNGETNWFHVFKSMVDSGDLAKMSGSDLKVYMVVKSYTNFNTGLSFPAIDTICAKSGLSESQVIRCLKSLSTYGYITKTKQGRSNVYTLREKVGCNDEDGNLTAMATWDYLPATVSTAQTELKNFLLTGKHDGTVIHVENLTLNVNNFSDKSQQTNMTLNDLPTDLKEKVGALITKAKNKMVK